MTPLLLDTHALVWLVEGVQLSRPIVAQIVAAATGPGVLVSPVSAWELGMLANPKRGRPALILLPDVKSWYARAIAAPALTETPLTADIAIDASTLPAPMHGDLADRLLVSTARSLGATLVTRDTRLIAYAATGAVSVLPC